MKQSPPAKQQSPLVSFFVPTYQYGHYLDFCVRSILAQTYENLEVLILDDRSTDNTSDVAQHLSREDKRVIYIRNPENKGHIANYNAGISQAKGEFIWGLSADDALASPDVLARYVQALNDHPNLGLFFCRAQVMDEDNTPVEKWIPRQDYALLKEKSTVYPGRAFFRKILVENFVPVAAALARKSAYEKAGLYHPRLTHTGDWFLWMQFSLDWDVFYEPEAMVYYRIHQKNMHRTYDSDTHAMENTLACYEELGRYLEAKGYGFEPKLLTQLALLRYKKKHQLDLTRPEKLLNTFVRPFMPLRG